MNLRERLERLYSKAAFPKSVDFYRPAMYRFDKYCKCCHSGMKKPAQHERRELKSLFRKGYCSKQCQIVGPVPLKQGANLCGDHAKARSENVIEEYAFLSVELSKRESNLKPIQNLLMYAERTFTLMSEKLRFMEVQTGEKWYPNKLYRTLEKIEECRL